MMYKAPHQAEVQIIKMKDGIPTVIVVDGRRYVLDMKGTPKKPQ